MNRDETEATETVAPCSMSELVTEYDLTTLVRTTEPSISIYDGEREHRFSVRVNDAPTDTVGAGDAFTSRCLQGVLRGEAIDTRTEAARERASEPVEHVGSLLPRFWKNASAGRSTVDFQR